VTCLPGKPATQAVVVQEATLDITPEESGGLLT
jgi:hypothetical protein